MKSMLMLWIAILALPGMTVEAHAGRNAGCHARITWGNSMTDSIPNIRVAAGRDTEVTFFVSIVGLNNIRGIDLQLPVIGVGEANHVLQVPSAWQFEPGAGCDNEVNAQLTSRFPGCAIVGIKTLMTALSGCYMGSPDRFALFSGMPFFALTCAGAQGVDREPKQRYGLARVTLTISGKTCLGADAPVCIQPSLRLGHPKDLGPLVGVVDQDLEYDYAPMDPGFDHISANLPGTSCPLPSPAPVAAWQKVKGGIKH